MRLHTEPETDWKNIFQLWKENGEKLPFKVAKSTWSAEAGHYLVVEKIEIKEWPYGSAWGRYHWGGGAAGPQEKVKAAGVYKWKLLDAPVASVDAAQVGDLIADRHVGVECLACGHVIQVPASVIRAKLDPKVALKQLPRHFSCRRCGKRGAVRLVIGYALGYSDPSVTVPSEHPE